jgi:putative endonuclease
MTTIRQKRGTWAELRALQHMQAGGLLLLIQNYRCKTGEIDIIGWEDNILVFAEVRYRTSSQFGAAADTVGFRKQRKTVRAAQRFLQQNPHLNAPCRFDVLALDNNNSINWIRDAYTL